MAILLLSLSQKSDRLFQIDFCFGTSRKGKPNICKEKNNNKTGKKTKFEVQNGCNYVRNHSRHNLAILMRCLLHHHWRHLQAPPLLNSLCLTGPLLSRVLLVTKFYYLEGMAFPKYQIRCLLLFTALVFVQFSDLSFGHSGMCASQVHECHSHHHCDHVHDHDHHHHHHDVSLKLPEELAEEEDLKLNGFGFGFEQDYDHGHEHFAASELSGLGNLSNCAFRGAILNLLAVCFSWNCVFGFWENDCAMEINYSFRAIRQ